MSGDRALYTVPIHIVRRLFDVRRSGTVTFFIAMSFFFIFYITYEFLYPMDYQPIIYPRGVLSVS